MNNFESIKLPRIKSVSPKLMSGDLMSVQPMTIPVDGWANETVVHHCTDSCKEKVWVHDFIKGWIFKSPCPGEGTTTITFRRTK